jgi:hypothetical protein
MAPATHHPAPSDTQGNASRQLAVVVVFGQGAFKKKNKKTGVPTYLPFFEIF